MRKVIDRYFINHGIDACNMKTFMRTTMQRNGEYVHLSEADGWVYNGGAPASQAAYLGRHVSFLEFTTQEEVRISD